MRRIAIVFAVLVTIFVTLIGIKVSEMRAEALKPSGGSAVIEGVEAAVTSRLPARIAKITVHEGDPVKAGDVLVELDCREQEAILEAALARLAAAEHQAEAARAQVSAASGAANAALAGVGAAGSRRQALETNRAVTERQVKRIDRLKGEGGATESELDRASAQATQLGEEIRALDASLDAAKGQAKAASAQAEAAKAQAEAAVNAISAAQAEVKRARAMADECRLVAPIDGHVEARAYEPGEVVLPGSKVLTLVRIDVVEATFYLPNRELAAAKVGRTVRVVADAIPGKSFSGTIIRVAAKAEFTPRNVQTREDRDRLVYAVTASIENGGEELRPGMPVEVVVDGTGGGS
jgi:HlyD family secretion protein